MTLKDALTDLNLYLKINTSEALNLADLNKIIPSFWNYFRDNWKTIKPNVEAKIDGYAEPSLLQQHILDFDNFIGSRRYASSYENPFNNNQVINQFYAIFEATDVSELSLRYEESQIIQREINRVKNYNKKNFLQARKALEEARNEIADRGGVIDEEFNKIYNRVPKAKNHDINLSDMVDALQLQQSIDAVNEIIANLKQGSTAKMDPFALARQNAKNQELIIGGYTSGYLVRFNYGDTLQTISNKYLGDPDRWLDIAIANGLQPPYIDEIGEKVLILNAGENNLIISNKDALGNNYVEKIFTNHPIFLSSSEYPYPEQRNIINIEEHPLTNSIVITVDGDSDLGKYNKSEGGAYLRFFLPKTINSNFMILIPSNSPTDTPLKEMPWYLKNKAADEKQAGIDLYINDETKDLAFTSFGDIQLSYGVANAMQAIYLKLNSELGSLKRHPQFGIVNILGSSNRDIESLRSRLVASLTNNIDSDPRFSSIENLSVIYKRDSVNYFLIKITVKLSGGAGTTIPISFRVNI